MTLRYFGPLIGALLAGACTPSVIEGLPDGASDFIPSETCEVGIYQGDTDLFVAVTRSAAGYNFTFSNGEVGASGEEPSRLQCGSGRVIVDGEQAWTRQTMRETDTRFRSGEVELVGRLMETEDAGPDTPLVVFAHGSESTPWLERAREPYQMLGRGISVFVYDKRGTGASGGQYSQNFPQLADDLASASAEAKRLAEGRFGRFGLFGLSQGGWIAPLAANRAKADFIGVGYGLVADIREEDAMQVQMELRDAGYGPDALAAAADLTDITARLVASEYRDGLEDLERFQQRYRSEPWYSKIAGSYSGVLLNTSVGELRRNGIPRFANLNIDWSHDPMKVMRQTEAPQLWILAGEDREAPLELSRDRLISLIHEGEDIRIATFPLTDHGMWEYREAGDGTRRVTRFPAGYFDLMADWAKGSLDNSYGTSEFAEASGGS